MKKYFLFACVAAAMASCSSDDFFGNEGGLAQKNDGAILFKSTNMKASRANQVGAQAAATLGENFIVEGVKSAKDAAFSAGDLVFDNYLVAWEQNSAGTTEDNTNDWKYVGVTGTTNCPSAVLSEIQQTATNQTLKFWDYSKDAYNFIAYSTGTLAMVAGTDVPVKNTSVHVTSIDKANSATAAYVFSAKAADDFAQCYYTDVTPVLKTNFGQPVTLSFKNLSAKVRIAMYETVPGYAVKDVKFYQVDAADASVADLGSATSTSATLIGSASFPEAGKITVKYPATAAVQGSLGDNWNKADVLVAPTTAAGDPTYKEWGNLAYVAGEGELSGATAYLGTTLPTASFAGASADEYYKFVIPTNGAADALTLRVDYTLESIDGSGEVINVYGAKAVVPATFTKWNSNTAYTYVFKISDNTNGWTSTDPSDPTGLFPITFDAVVESIVDASAEQTTVTTVATPTVTSYQYGHEMNANYGTGKAIYVQVMDNSVVPATIKSDLAAAKCKLYSVPTGTTEADVASALNIQDPAATDATKITGRNTTVLTISGVPTLNFSIADTEIKFKDGTSTKPGAAKAAYFTPTAAGTYAFVYEAKASTGSTPLYTYVAAVSKQASAPANWASDYTKYYTKNANGTYTAATSTYDDTAYYYTTYNENNAVYAVKVIVVE